MQWHLFYRRWLRRVLGSFAGSAALSLAFLFQGQAAPGSLRVWTGEAFPQTNWANGRNWVNSGIPLSDDDVFFPADVPGMTNFNNLPAGTAFNSITLWGPGYSLFGAAPLLLTAGLSSTNSSGTNTIQAPLLINGGTCLVSNAEGGTLVLNGAVDLNGQGLTVANAGNVFVFNSITNSGGIVKTGMGTLQLGRSNSYDGLTQVLEGKVIVLDDDALGSPANETVVAAGAELQILNGRVMTESLRLAGTLSSRLSTNNIWAGSITLLDSNVVVAVNSGGTLSVGGLVDGSGGIRKTESGDLTLAADNTYTGLTVIESGSLFVNGTQPSSAVTVAPGGVLRGVNGHCGAVSNAPFGTIRPGDPVLPAVLQIDGSLTCVPFSMVDLRISNGAGFDQLTVTGPVDLGGATLQVQLLTAAPPVGTSFELIRNDGADAIVGTFAGLPEGALYLANGAAFHITYAGGDGNDVVLTRANEPTRIGSIVCLTNGFKQVQGEGLPSARYVLEAAANLNTVPVLWAPIATNAANGAGVYQFIDQDSLVFPMRFYRVQSP